MRFEDWIKTLPEDRREFGRKIIAHNNAISKSHNGQMGLSTVEMFHESKYHYTVLEFDAHCGSIGQGADYPLGDWRWYVTVEMCKLRYEDSLKPKS